MVIKSKIENFEKVREFVHNLGFNTTTNYEIQKKFNLNYIQAHKILTSLVELGELKYTPISKIYVRDEKDIIINIKEE